MGQEHWTISKQFNLSILIGIAGQTVALVWFIAGLDGAVQSNAKEIIRQEARLDTMEKIVQDQAVTMARMDANIQAIREMMEKSE